MASIPFYARRFVAGTQRSEALDVVARTNQEGIHVFLDVLGEDIGPTENILAFTHEYLNLLNDITYNDYKASVSLKPTMFGLNSGVSTCLTHLTPLFSKADALNIRVALDMESSAHTEPTLQLYEAAASQFKCVEAVLQAYLFRTSQDIERVLKANGKIRLCKGAYKEPAHLAHQTQKDIRQAYIDYLKRLLTQGQRVCIATHDDSLLKFAQEFILHHNIPTSRYEFQMLYGLRYSTAKALQKQKHDVTLYIPYGIRWKAYFLRRLSERKENIFFIVKNFFKS
jgi:proline dehydrogenase